jgi:transcriptional regulator with XRE-family HTH domain
VNRAKQIRLDAGAGIADVAVDAGISTKTLNKIEAGEPVAAAALARLATYWQVKPSTLLMPAIEPGQEAA